MHLKHRVLTHDWDEDFAARVLAERLDLIKELIVLPLSTLAIILEHIPVAKRVKITLLMQAFTHEGKL